MKIIAIIITLVCCCLMFYLKREKKAALLIIGAMTLAAVSISGIPFRKANLLLQVAFLLSEREYLQQHIRYLRHMPWLKNLFLLVSGSALLAALTSPYTGIKEMIEYDLLFGYFSLAYAFWAVENEKTLKPILKVSLYCLIVLTFFGVLNFMEKSSMFVNALTENRSTLGGVAIGDRYLASSRFRVQSMYNSAFDYGYICAAILLLHLHGWYRQLESKRVFIIAIVCCSFGIITCGCRIILVSAIFSITCYSMWVFHLSRNVMFGMIAVILIIISYNTVPAVEEKVNQMTDVFLEDGDTKGSSIQLRMAQFMYVQIYTEGSEWLGLGSGYWAYNFDVDPRAVRDLYGIESVIFSYLLERGIIGLVIWATFYTIIFLYFKRNRKRCKSITGLGASLLTLYLVFSIGTGELGSVYPTMLLLGFAIKSIECC